MTAEPKPVLVCDGLRFSWDAKGRALTLPDFEVAAGERVFVCGPSGSGKSTLLGLIAGVMKPTAGSVEALGQSLSTLGSSRRDRFRADHIGYVFQQFNLLPYLGVVENVLLSCIFSKRRAKRASAVYPIRTEAARLLLALGLDAELLERRTVGELSVGQQQRVAVARALIGAPELIIADEPTSALDTQTRDAFVSLLLAECARHRIGLVFVSHDMALTHHFDRTVLLGPTAPIRH
jgi:putative ABC transport system ATP-binding protein